jgi:hypothetical protein
MEALMIRENLFTKRPIMKGLGIVLEVMSTVPLSKGATWGLY